MTLYCGIDLHSNNSYVFVGDEADRAVFAKRLPNRLDVIVRSLEPFRDELEAVAVESTPNWYWLVDGLVDHHFSVRLVNPSAIVQYEGLKFTDDRHDARWLTHLMRLGILPTGYIYPREQRAVRDLARRRARLVQKRTDLLLSNQNVIARNTGLRLTGQRLKRFDHEALSELISEPHVALAIDSTLQIIDAFDEQIDRLEKQILASIKLAPSFQILKTIGGVGDIIALTVMLETGDISRFPSVGNFVSYCRCVNSERRTNRRKKGEGNRKNGNPYLSWAFSEAATFALRYQPEAKRFYDRKRAKTKHIVAIRALAHKLARASYCMLRDQVPYDPALLFR